MNIKDKIRQDYLSKRKALSAKDVEHKSRNIADIFWQLDYVEATTFHVFLPLKKFKEVDTYTIIHRLWALGKKVVVPKMDGKNLLNCHFTPTTKLQKNQWEIDEPEACQFINHQEIDVVLMPLLVCDGKGNRIGYGGGFYDRFLPKLRNDCILIGVNFFEPVEEIPAEKHDVPLHALVTPKGFILF